MTAATLRNAVPRLAVVAAVLGFLYDAPHLLFDANYAVASDHPLFIFHAVMGILMMVVLVVVLAGLLLRTEGRVTGPLPLVAGAVTLTGLVFAAGGTWGEGLMIPYLADIDPSVFADDVGGYLLAVIMLGDLLFCSGWLLMSVLLRRSEVLTKGSAIALGAASVVALVPLPLTTFLVVAVLAVVTQRLDVAPAPVVERPRVATA
jgi:hypothetical protein